MQWWNAVAEVRDEITRDDPRFDKLADLLPDYSGAAVASTEGTTGLSIRISLTAPNKAGARYKASRAIAGMLQKSGFNGVITDLSVQTEEEFLKEEGITKP